jgi:hypothetical protein
MQITENDFNSVIQALSEVYIVKIFINSNIDEDTITRRISIKSGSYYIKCNVFDTVINIKNIEKLH